jgi:hypothetical protein
MILGRLYTIIFSARVQEIPSLYYDVKKFSAYSELKLQVSNVPKVVGEKEYK